MKMEPGGGGEGGRKNVFHAFLNHFGGRDRRGNECWKSSIPCWELYVLVEQRERMSSREESEVKGREEREIGE